MLSRRIVLIDGPLPLRDAANVGSVIVPRAAPKTEAAETAKAT